jgi:protein HOOK3
MYSDKSNERMVQVMHVLGPKVMQPIAMYIGEVEELDQKLADSVADAEPGSEIGHFSDSEAPVTRRSFERDPELEREERLIQALQERRRLEAQVADLAEELQQTKAQFTKVEEKLAEANFTLDRRRRRTIDEEELEQLSAKADRDKDYIAELETDLASAKAAIEQQERQLERFRQDDANKQDLRDELQMVKTERNELLQKAKANENLKKKIQTLQEQERANQALRTNLQSANEQLQELEALRDRCTALEKANDENAQTIANGEQEIFDQKTSKKRLEHEVKLLGQKFEQTRDLLSNAQERNRELEEQLNEYESRQSASLDQLNSLDTELNADSGAGDERDKRKNTLIRSTSGADTIILQQKLTIAESSVSRLEQKCLDLLQENLGYKSILDGTDGTKEDSQAFAHQTKRLEEVSKELEDSKSKYIAATSEIADLNHRLEACGAVTLTNGDSTFSQNQERQKYTEQLETELHDQKALLRHALLSNPALQKEDNAIRQTNEYRIIREQLEVVHSAPPQEVDQVIAATATKIADKVEKGRSTVVESEKVGLHYPPNPCSTIILTPKSAHINPNHRPPDPQHAT